MAGLEFSSGVEAEVIGKPERTFFNSALKHMNTLFGTDIGPQGEFNQQVIVILKKTVV